MAKRQVASDSDSFLTDHRAKVAAQVASEKERQYLISEEYDEEELYAFDDPKLYRALQGR